MMPDLERRLESILSSDLIEAERNMISKNGLGEYDVFSKWILSSRDGLVEVRTAYNIVGKFSNLRSALSWCIAEKYNQLQLSREIRRLDEEYQRHKHTDIVYRMLSKNTKDPQKKSITATKAHEAHAKYCVTKERLARCVSRAKYLQIKGFNDEIARTRRPAPYKTSRENHRKSGRSPD